MHGEQRPDPWHWLRDDDRNDPEMLAYLEAENAYTEAALAPGAAAAAVLLDELKGRIEKDDTSVPVKQRGYWYYRRFEGESEYPVYCRRKGSMEAPEEILLDVNALAKPHDYYAVGAMAVSEDLQLLAAKNAGTLAANVLQETHMQLGVPLSALPAVVTTASLLATAHCRAAIGAAQQTNDQLDKRAVQLAEKVGTIRKGMQEKLLAKVALPEIEGLFNIALEVAKESSARVLERMTQET